MKKKIIYIAALGLFTLGSCADSFLDSEPIIEVTDGNFYRSKGDAEKAIVGCYDGLQRVWVDGIAFPVMSEVCSDNVFGGTGNADTWEYQVFDEFDQSVSPSDRDIFNENWKAYYAAIFRCNLLLSKMDQINWAGDDDYRLSIECQARYLRAFFYFDMVRMWENIPLLTAPSTDNIPQSPVDDVYKVIAEDLKYVGDNMKNEVYSTAWAADNDGRVTKWAAKALLARVYMFYTGYYGKSDLVGVTTKSEVLTGLEDVISNGGYSLLDDYATMWPGSAAYARNKNGGSIVYAGKGNTETIFSVKYNYTSNYDGRIDGNHWLVMLGLRNVTVFPYSKGWGACTVTPALWNTFSDKDRRKELSIINIESESIAADIKDQREYTGYTNKKYTLLSTYDADGKLLDAAEALGAVNFQIGQFQDYVSIRYADVLLMAAELGSAGAQTYFDDVRKRAYKTDFTSLAVSKDNILKERRLEFAFEGIRYWDVLRQGLSTAATTLASSTTVKSGGNTVTKEVKAANITKTRGFQQIPEDQITKSKGVLKQNVGWE